MVKVNGEEHGKATVLGGLVIIMCCISGVLFCMIPMSDPVYLPYLLWIESYVLREWWARGATAIVSP